MGGGRYKRRGDPDMKRRRLFPRQRVHGNPLTDRDSGPLDATPFPVEHEPVRRDQSNEQNKRGSSDEPGPEIPESERRRAHYGEEIQRRQERKDKPRVRKQEHVLQDEKQNQEETKGTRPSVCVPSPGFQ